MSIPSVSQFRVPLLRILGDGKERSLAEAAAAVADVFNLTQEEREAVLSSGTVIIKHRTSWSNFHLRKAGLAADGRPASSRSRSRD